jgi:hypothetical protein
MYLSLHERFRLIVNKENLFVKWKHTGNAVLSDLHWTLLGEFSQPVRYRMNSTLCKNSKELISFGGKFTRMQHKACDQLTAVTYSSGFLGYCRFVRIHIETFILNYIMFIPMWNVLGCLCVQLNIRYDVVFRIASAFNHVKAKFTQINIPKDELFLQHSS